MKKLLLLLLFTSCARQGSSPAAHYQARRQLPAILVVLDAGHGGHDPGAISPDKSAQEKDLALATTFMAERHLERLGYRVHLTRQGDTFIPLKERAGIANDLDAALFVSIHYNAAKTPKPCGIEVYRWRAPEDSQREKDSQEAATLVLARILRYTNANDRGVKQANFAVLRETAMPAILVEAGYVTNKEELKRLKDPSYQNAVAYGIAQGVHDYFLEKYRPRRDSNARPAA